MTKLILSSADVAARATVVARRLSRKLDAPLMHVYGIPRGGIPAAFAVADAYNRDALSELRITDDPKLADVFIDDIIDSGRTRDHYLSNHGIKPFFALVDKFEEPDIGWVVFPWEGTVESSAEDIPLRLLQFIGEDTERPGLVETPARVVKAWQHWTRGYAMDPAALLKSFDDGAERVDEMVVVRDIPFYSHCEHHLAPFFGTADVAYIPEGRIVGLSKLARVVDAFAARLQVQERLTNQIADTIASEVLAPKGVGVRLTARHLCMESRGITKAGATTQTSALRGVFLEATTRAEFLSLLR